MKAAVIEDSDFARDGLVAMLSAYPDLDIVCAAGDADTALERLEATAADVLFLDIHMPGKSGFDLLASLSYSPLIVFTTAYSEYAIRSFDFNTVDYLLKPVSRERLDQALAKLRDRFATSAAEEPGDTERSLEAEPPLQMHSRLLIRDRDRCHLVELSHIRYFESCKNEARAFFAEHKAYIKRNLNHLEQRLPAAHFFRASRQYIVNLQAVTSIEESISKGFSLIMNDGQEIEISRRRAALLMEKLSI